MTSKRMSLAFFYQRDSNTESAPSVKKSCRWQVFSEGGAQTGTVSSAERSASSADAKHMRHATSSKKAVQNTLNGFFAYFLNSS